MHPLFHFLIRWKCKSVFHKLALGALRDLDGASARAWQSLLLWKIEPFLDGVDAPSEEFRDFTNHSFDPKEPWGTAPRLATKWYLQAREAFDARDWPEGTRRSGILLRYCTLSLMMFHGHHRDPGLSRRRIVAWYLGQNAERLRAEAELPQITAPLVAWRQGELEAFLAQAARAARLDEEWVFDHLRPVSADRPVLAPDGELDKRLGTHWLIIERALGSVLRRLTSEITDPPRNYPIGMAFAAGVPSIPIFGWTRARDRREQLRIIQPMMTEWAETGHIRQSAPPDLRALRDAYAIAHGAARTPVVPKPSIAPGTMNAPSTIPSKPRRVPTTDHIPLSIARGRPETPPAGPISLNSPVGVATSMSSEVAESLYALGVHSVRDLLDSSLEELAAKLAPRATRADLSVWCDEASLSCEIPLLMPVESQLLVACGVTGRRDLAVLSPVELWELVIPVAESPDGARILRDSPIPNLDTVSEWIQAAQLPAA